MEKNLNPSKFDSSSHTLPETHENSRCETCGEEFKQPLFAAVSSGSLIEEYHACPRCLSKVGGVECSRNVEVDKAEDVEEDNQPQEKEVEIEVDKTEETAVCPHYLGYLKKRQKDSPIPEECLICSKMIECISY